MYSPRAVSLLPRGRHQAGAVARGVEGVQGDGGEHAELCLQQEGEGVLLLPDRDQQHHWWTCSEMLQVDIF